MAETKIAAPQALIACRNIAQRIADSADAYIAAMAAAPRPQVNVGGFYRCFDGSVVYIARRKTECQCAQCRGRAAGMPAVMAAIMEQIAPQSIPEHEAKPDDEEPRYIAVVIRGGHLLKGYSGEEPGDRYIIDKNGWVALPELDAGTPTEAVSAVFLSMAGLSLQTELRAAFTAIEPAEGAAQLLNSLHNRK
jgi:hypothetical protein